MHSVFVHGPVFRLSRVACYLQGHTKLTRVLSLVTRLRWQHLTGADWQLALRDAISLCNVFPDGDVVNFEDVILVSPSGSRWLRDRVRWFALIPLRPSFCQHVEILGEVDISHNILFLASSALLIRLLTGCVSLHFMRPNFTSNICLYVRLVLP
jgi:hypothetical protein